jgi:hypothetical protein
MLEAAVRTQNQGLEVFDHQSAPAKLQDVLSHRLPSFYRCAFRLLGNAADAEDAVQDQRHSQCADRSHVSRRKLPGLRLE